MNVNVHNTNTTKPDSNPLNTYLVKDEVEIERLIPKNAVIIQTKTNRDKSDKETKKSGERERNKVTGMKTKKQNMYMWKCVLGNKDFHGNH